MIEMLLAIPFAMAVGAAVTLVLPPPRRLRHRLRPYIHAQAAALGKAVADPARPRVPIAARLGAALDTVGAEALALKLRQARLFVDVPTDRQVDVYHTRQLVATIAGLALGAGAAAALGLSTVASLLLIGLGALAGGTRMRGKLERALEERRVRLRIEIYTVNQLLAMRVRVGGGVLQAVQHVVRRGVGEVAGELAEVMRAVRSGVAAADALAEAAKRTPEPYAARTYWLLATAHERGSDLAAGLLALSEDVREARREAMRRAATKRRAATLIPTIAILAPVMLLFVAAPLPSIVFGGL